MSGIHGLKHVEGLFSSDLTYDDPIRPHPQAVADEITLNDLPFSLNVWWPGLKPHYMLLLKLQFSGILNRNDPFIFRYKP
jgi:hypothetical protein